MRHIVWHAYERSIDPRASVQERAEAQRICDDFKNNPEVCVPLSIEWAQSADPKACFFGLHCLEHAIKTRWAKLPSEFQLGIRNSVLNLLKTRRSERYLSTMLSRCLSHIIEKDWPQNWPNMLQELESVGEVTALRIFLEEVFLYESISTSKRRELATAVQNRLVPQLFPQLLAVLTDPGSPDDRVSLVLSVLLPIVQLSPNPNKLLELLGERLANPQHRKLCLDCVERMVKTGRRKLPITESILPALSTIQPSCQDPEFIEPFASLLQSAYTYDQESFKKLVRPYAGVLYGLLVNEELGTECPDSFYDLLSVICDVTDWMDDGQLVGLLRAALRLSNQQVSRDADMDESRSIARVRVVTQRFCTILLRNYTALASHELVRMVAEGNWASATFFFQCMENSNEIVQAGLRTTFSGDHHATPAFIQAAFRHADSDAQAKMLDEVLSPTDEQSKMAVLVNLARDQRCQNVLRARISLLMERLSGLEDCLAASLMAESVLILVKGGELEEKIVDWILEPCKKLFNADAGPKERSVAIHLLTAIARSMADTVSGQSKLKPFVEPAVRLAFSDQCPLKAVDFLAACIPSTFFPDQGFAEQCLCTTAEVQRAIIRQMALPLAAKENLSCRDFLLTLLLRTPAVVEGAYAALPQDLSPEQDSTERQLLALLSRDIVELFRKTCLANDYLERLRFPIAMLIGSCFQSVYIFPDSVAVQRLLPVCNKFVDRLTVDMEVPALMCCLRSLKTFLMSDREALGHELTVISSQLFDRILNRVGVEVATELFREQVGAVQREDILRYREAIASGDVNEKKRKKIAEALFTPALMT